MIDPEVVYRLIDTTHTFVDRYMVGKLNHYTSRINWRGFHSMVTAKLNEYNASYYIKADLANEAGR